MKFNPQLCYLILGVSLVACGSKKTVHDYSAQDPNKPKDNTPYSGPDQAGDQGKVNQAQRNKIPEFKDQELTVVMNGKTKTFAAGTAYEQNDGSFQITLYPTKIEDICNPHSVPFFGDIFMIHQKSLDVDSYLFEHSETVTYVEGAKAMNNATSSTHLVLKKESESKATGKLSSLFVHDGDTANGNFTITICSYETQLPVGQQPAPGSLGALYSSPESDAANSKAAQ